MTETARTYRAFISYSHRDKAVAAWVQAALERYHVPAKLVGKETALGPVPARLHPLFRDRDELPASADLGSELRAALANSLFLIVVCSPAAAQSRWVGEEVLAFKRTHGEGRVLALICDGEPGDPARECFPEPLQFLIGAHGDLSPTRAEPIAADIRPGKDGRKLAKLKLIAALTGLRLDDLAQREAARRARRMTIVAAASLIGMVLALGLALYANTQRIAAIEQRKIAETESAASRAAADFLVGTFKLSNPATENPRTITALTILGRSADRARKELANQPEIQVRLIDTVAKAYTNLGLYEDARAALTKSRATIDALGAKGVPPLLTLAHVDFWRGNLDGSIRTAEIAEGRLGRSAKNDPPAVRELRGRAREIEAQALYEKNDLKGALEAYDQALNFYRRAPAKSEVIARLLNNRGLLLTGMGRYQEAALNLNEAIRRFTAVYGPESLKVGQVWEAIASNVYAEGNTKEALPIIRKSSLIYRKVLDPKNRVLTTALSLEGQILRDLGRPNEAVRPLTEAVSIQKESFGKPHFLIGITEVYLALALADAGKIERALTTLDDAKHNYDVGYGELNANHGDLLVNRATILAKVGRLAEAKSDCRTGLSILDKTMDKSDALYTSLTKTCAAIAARQT